MLETIRRFVLKNPVQVGAVMLVLLLTALEIIFGGADPLDMLIRWIFYPLF